MRNCTKKQQSVNLLITLFFKFYKTEDLDIVPSVVEPKIAFYGTSDVNSAKMDKMLKYNDAM